MKFYNPLFSIIVIIIQLIISLKGYYDFVQWGKDNPELDALVNRGFNGDSLLLFVLLIGFYEMTTKLGWFKTVLRIFLVSIVLGTYFSGIIPIDNFYYGVYNTAWFSTILAVILIVFRINK
jgi:hypothetical protein